MAACSLFKLKEKIAAGVTTRRPTRSWEKAGSFSELLVSKGKEKALRLKTLQLQGLQMRFLVFGSPNYFLSSDARTSPTPAVTYGLLRLEVK
jgi:hypothetical protein